MPEIRHIGRTERKANKDLSDKGKKIRDYRKEVSRRASMANKRLRRLEATGMATPALEKWKEDGGEYFSIRGKSYNEVQSEMARINQYLDSATSSISGAKKVVNEMIDNTGMDIEWSDWKDVRAKTKAFFDISSKIEQYLRTVEDRASSIGYQKIWSAINRYVKDMNMDLADVEANVENITADIVDAMDVWDEDKRYTAKGENYEYWNWTKLGKY